MGKHILKNYNNLIKQISINKKFSIRRTGRKNTIMIKHVSSGATRTVHPGEKACKPLKKWIDGFET